MLKLFILQISRVNI